MFFLELLPRGCNQASGYHAILRPWEVLLGTRECYPSLCLVISAYIYCYGLVS